MHNTASERSASGVQEPVHSTHFVPVEHRAAPPATGYLRFVPPGMRGVALAALGVVFGDIGTSPLYAFRQCFTAPHGVAPTHSNILGLVSLIFWSLILVISIKYVVVMLKADNRGEGGVLALSTLLAGTTRNWKLWAPVSMAGVMGAALFFGDGMLTPAVSVLSAVEGVAVAAPHLQRFVLPATVLVLICLFVAQKKGTGAVGRAFGPIIILWFTTIAVLGIIAICRAPQILWAFNPLYAADFFIDNGWQGFVALSAVFLAVTGGEALYADMGHFGRVPIRNAWFQLVLPALTLNYFGQGALLLNDGAAAVNPFYLLAPTWLLPPLIVLATAATIIASQAVISGVFSVASQAVNLGYLPRIDIRHSSETEMGQVYVPAMNWMLLAGTLLLVLAFRSSDALAGAYGIAVSSTMLLAGIMVDLLAQIRKTRPHPFYLAMLIAISLVDLGFFSSNLLKFTDGGWLPVLVAGVIYIIMATWHEGRRTLNWIIAREQISSREFIAELSASPPQCVPGTAVYLSSEASVIPRALTQNLRFFGALHERSILLTFIRAEVPRLATEERFSVETLAPHLYRVTARYGFMENPDALAALRGVEEQGLEYRPEETVYIVGRETPLVTSQRGMAIWRKRLFALMSRNSQFAPAHFGVPVRRVLEVGSQTTL